MFSKKSYLEKKQISSNNTLTNPNIWEPTCDGFDYTVRHFRDLLIYRNTQHLYGDPVKFSGTKATWQPSDGFVSGIIRFSMLLCVLT